MRSFGGQAGIPRGSRRLGGLVIESEPRMSRVGEESVEIFRVNLNGAGCVTGDYDEDQELAVAVVQRHGDGDACAVVDRLEEGLATGLNDLAVLRVGLIEGDGFRRGLRENADGEKERGEEEFHLCVDATALGTARFAWTVYGGNSE